MIDMRTPCSRYRFDLEAFVDRREVGPTTADALAHLETCRSCEEEVEQLALAVFALRRLGSEARDAGVAEGMGRPRTGIARTARRGRSMRGRTAPPSGPVGRPSGPGSIEPASRSGAAAPSSPERSSGPASWPPSSARRRSSGGRRGYWMRPPVDRWSLSTQRAGTSSPSRPGCAGLSAHERRARPRHRPSMSASTRGSSGRSLGRCRGRPRRPWDRLRGDGPSTRPTARAHRLRTVAWSS